MEVSGFFWDGAAQASAAPKRFPWSRQRTALKVGNAGDIFNRDLVRYLYGAELANSELPGRLLLVGSVIHRAQPGDIVCGVGTKGVALKPRAELGALNVRAVRGPITRHALAEAGQDVSGIRFELDPGLLIAELFPELRAIGAERNKVLFIPHYRDRHRFRDNKKYRVADIDCEAVDLAKEIASAEHVYSSSLHGVIFAHALGRTCTLVAPLNPEPEIKYRDYFASVGAAWSQPVDLDEAMKQAIPDQIDVPNTIDAFDFPTLAELLQVGIARED